MFFFDEIFAIEPLSGRIWSRSQCTVTVVFSPKAALHYQCVAYCSVVGCEDRVPLLLKGTGIGPKAAFSYDELDVGDIFVESVHRYEVQLLNQGDIAVHFQLVPNNAPFASKFKFSPSEGKLGVGESVTITAEFCPDLLGEFHETFFCELVGSASSIPITFKGHSVFPTFTFVLRIPGDGRFLQKEFDIIPNRGTLLPNCSQKIQVDFISVNLKTYDLALVVDLDGVGQELASILIQARCMVPTAASSRRRRCTTRTCSSATPSTSASCCTTRRRSRRSSRSCRRTRPRRRSRTSSPTRRPGRCRRRRRTC